VSFSGSGSRLSSILGFQNFPLCFRFGLNSRSKVSRLRSRAFHSGERPCILGIEGQVLLVGSFFSTEPRPTSHKALDSGG
jgi:hypothetical protein